MDAVKYLRCPGYLPQQSHLSPNAHGSRSTKPLLEHRLVTRWAQQPLLTEHAGRRRELLLPTCGGKEGAWTQCEGAGGIQPPPTVPPRDWCWDEASCLPRGKARPMVSSGGWAGTLVGSPRAWVPFWRLRFNLDLSHALSVYMSTSSLPNPHQSRNNPFPTLPSSLPARPCCMATIYLLAGVPR